MSILSDKTMKIMNKIMNILQTKTRTDGLQFSNCNFMLSPARITEKSHSSNVNRNRIYCLYSYCYCIISTLYVLNPGYGIMITLKGRYESCFKMMFFQISLITSLFGTSFIVKYHPAYKLVSSLTDSSGSLITKGVGQVFLSLNLKRNLSKVLFI